MRKIIVIAIMLSMYVGGRCQNHEYTVDSAEMVVQNYIRLMNFDAIKSDSTLYIESYIYQRSDPHDTTIMKRWFLPPFNYRTEVWHSDTMVTGLSCNGKDVYMMYSKGNKRWEDANMSSFYNEFWGYDFHGPLFKWKTDNTHLQYKGIWKFNDQEVYRIFVTNPDRYERYYMFDKRSGLLFLIDETDSHSDRMVVLDDEHVDWRAYHEYQPVGKALLPSIESYQYGGDITLIFHTYKYVTKDEKLFIQK